MSIDVYVRTVASMKLAAVRRHVAIGGVGAAWKPALDKVWEFLQTQPGLRTNGHSVFLYHHLVCRDPPMDVDFGVEVLRAFESAGEVYATETPAGMVAEAVHVGAYDRMKERTMRLMHGARRTSGPSRQSRGRSTATGRTIRRSSKRLLCICSNRDDEGSYRSQVVRGSREPVGFRRAPAESNSD